MSELWRPSPPRIADANLTRFMGCVNARRGTQLREFGELYAWSLAEPGHFWSELARFADVRADWGAGPLIEHPGRMPGARFFPGARLNFAANLLRFDDDQPALVFRNERGTRRTLSYRELRTQVARVADGLRGVGVVAGDRVAGFLPNLPKQPSRCSPRRASGPPGRRARRTSACAACSIASGRFNPRCCSPPTATSTPAGSSIRCSPCQRCWRNWRRSSSWW